VRVDDLRVEELRVDEEIPRKVASGGERERERDERVDAERGREKRQGGTAHAPRVHGTIRSSAVGITGIGVRR
jgi:hypothetical protein